MNELDSHFYCDKCGFCCQKLSNNSLYEDLDRGDGICKYYIEETHLCSIYYTRPTKCNVEAFYNEFMSDKIAKDEFYQLNYMACEQLKREVMH